MRIAGLSGGAGFPSEGVLGELHVVGDRQLSFLGVCLDSSGSNYIGEEASPSLCLSFSHLRGLLVSLALSLEVLEGRIRQGDLPRVHQFFAQHFAVIQSSLELTDNLRVILRDVAGLELVIPCQQQSVGFRSIETLIHIRFADGVSGGLVHLLSRVV